MRGARERCARAVGYVRGARARRVRATCACDIKRAASLRVRPRCARVHSPFFLRILILTWFFLTMTLESSGRMLLSRLVLSRRRFLPLRPVIFRSKAFSLKSQVTWSLMSPTPSTPLVMYT